MDTQNTKSPFRLAATIIIVIIIVITVIYSYSGKTSPTTTNESHSYRDSASGFNITYPAGVSFTVETQATGTATTSVLYFKKGKTTMVLTPLVRPNSITDQERAFYEGAMFGGMKQNRNFRITMDEFTGFKTIIDFEHSRYLLYKPVGTDMTLALNIEFSAADNKSLNEDEPFFLSMLPSISVI